MRKKILTVILFHILLSRTAGYHFQGLTNINSFECRSSGEDSNGEILINIIDQGNSISFSDAGIILEINSFDCANQMITRDMHKALGGSWGFWV
jgi:hypothetical protein